MSQVFDKKQIKPAITKVRTSEEIKAEIELTFGFVPPFFASAEQTPQVLENLWQQTLIAYVDNPLPAIFKEKLSAYLSRFCAIPYCMICHSCTLRPLGIKASEVLKLLEAPVPNSTDIEEHLIRLTALSDFPMVWPQANSQLEESLLYCSIFIALPGSDESYRQELRRILGSINYQHLVAFIAYVKTCHVWIEAHPEVPYETDKRVIDNLAAILSEEPSLAYFFRNYKDLVKRESQSRAEQLAELAERRRTEEKIREQAALLDVASDAINVLTLDNEILFWNLGAERIYGWKQYEAVGKNASELLYREMPELEEFKLVVIESGFWEGELHQVSKFGKEIIVSSRWTLVRDKQGQPKSILVVNTDITEKKLLEAQFLRSQRLESIGTLASGIAHDLNNALGPILMIAELLQEKFSDVKTTQLLTELEASAKRGASLVKQVLSFGRGVEGKRTIIQIRHLLLEIEQIAKQTFPKSIKIYTDISSHLWTVCADATQLHQVLMNLVLNARDAMPDGGTLSIYAENLFIDEQYAHMNVEAKVGSYTVVTISDTGVGIPNEILHRIFEPFFTTKEVGKGTGLGLSTVMGIIKNHGGFVNVYSEVGQGTQFKVYLPAVEGAHLEQALDLEQPKGNGELVLVVDDELLIREITTISLEMSNYKVITASDGIEAIALYAQRKAEIRVVLMDMMMPEMDGRTTIRTLKKINSQILIIATSGLASTDRIAEAANIGAEAFLSKPYTTAELLKTLSLILNTKQQNY
ncbi:multi-sensor hybrid histidine kinase [Calothrix sp. NIES-4071]|nr:multi-sensor hybrid histidine kinase [Calothrix sp. NIES-4071]BAZ60450.1 multi-sensor hybrid histidine kinase [Calothrix sp. NIES-4105]